LEERYNSDLANGLGNLVSRTFALVEKHFDKIPELEKVDLSGFWKKYEENIEGLKLHNALSLVWEEISKCDIIIDKEKPWELAKKDKKKFEEILGDLLFRIKVIAQALLPFLPDSSKRILDVLEGADTFKDKSLFPRLNK